MVVALSPSAVLRVRTIAQEQHLDLATDAFLRVGVKDRSAIPPRYSLEVTTISDPALDLLGQQDGIRILVNRRDADFLHGTVIEYRATLKDLGFYFANPNVTTRPVQ